MKKKWKVPKLRLARLIPWAGVATAAVVVTVVLAVNNAKPVELAPTPEPSLIPATATFTVIPTETETPLPTATATPAFSIYGTWVPDRETTTVLVKQPPPGQYCAPNSSMWISPIIIEETADPLVARLYGLHEHLAYRDAPLDTATMQIVDTLPMPEIGQTLILVLRLEPDGRLYYEEQLLIGESLYCAASVYYVSAGE